MESITMMGIDLAKHSFQVQGVDGRGRAIFEKRCGRQKLLRLLETMPPCVVAMESCSGAHYWGRQARRCGHEIRIVPAQFVKPFVKSQKNDRNDAEAIVIAASQPTMRFVALKTPEQQEIQFFHRYRQRRVHQRTALTNQLRSMLEEFGIVMAQGHSALRRKLSEVLSDLEVDLSPSIRGLFERMASEFEGLNREIEACDQLLQQRAQTDERCQRLQGIPGVGPKIATAIIAAVGDPTNFHNGRQMAAWIGLVPAQCSTGGKPRLLGISKRGDKHLRSLIVHGARSLVFSVQRSGDLPEDRLRRWIQRKLEHKHVNRVVVAVANKLTRIMWVLLVRGDGYRSRLAART